MQLQGGVNVLVHGGEQQRRAVLAVLRPPGVVHASGSDVFTADLERHVRVECDNRSAAGATVVRWFCEDGMGTCSRERDSGSNSSKVTVVKVLFTMI